ncbi:phosphate propanoyltransferase [Pasteurellaceae bacterium LFhippo2]|nr:phosphate propanoyltransferase [Pasteurellaceae bacterium LFhippo2]
MNLEQAKLFAEQILNQMNVAASTALNVPIGVSNRHIHLSREDMDILFGQGSELTRLKAVKQPGQFAAKELVTLKGKKGEIKNVRVLGPLRKETQVEVSVADNYVLGIKAPICMSGELDNAEPLEIIGPCGKVYKEHCAIVAWRHIHIPPELAKQHNLVDGQSVAVQVNGIRGGLMQNVIVRVAQASVLEMHVDIEEANAYGLANDQLVRIVS